MGLDIQGFRNGTVAEDLHPIVRRHETGGDERLQIDVRQRLLGREFLERLKVDRLEFHTLQVRETELGHTALQRHLTSFET